MIATSPPTASSVGQRSKCVTTSEPRTSGETPIASSTTQLRWIPAPAACRAEAAAAMQAPPSAPMSTANEVAKLQPMYAGRARAGKAAGGYSNGKSRYGTAPLRTSSA